MGGPAGTMEGGRQAEVAKAILSSLDVPYVVAAPLLIQDMASWTKDGIAGLQVGGWVGGCWGWGGVASWLANSLSPPSLSLSSFHQTPPPPPPAPIQSVVLYSLPELDGAIDTVPLGGLVGDDIFLVPERVTRMAQRVKR